MEEPRRTREPYRAAVVYFSSMGPRWLRTVSDFTHVAVGNRHVVFDPFLSETDTPWYPAETYAKIVRWFNHEAVSILSPREVIGESQCGTICRLGPTTSFTAWMTAVLAGKDCVSTACLLLRNAGVRLPPMIRRPATLRGYLQVWRA